MLEVNNFYMLQFTDDTEKLKKLFVLFRNRSFEALALKLFRPKIEHNWAIVGQRNLNYKVSKVFISELLTIVYTKLKTAAVLTRLGRYS